MSRVSKQMRENESLTRYIFEDGIELVEDSKSRIIAFKDSKEGIPDFINTRTRLMPSYQVTGSIPYPFVNTQGKLLEDPRVGSWLVIFRPFCDDGYDRASESTIREIDKHFILPEIKHHPKGIKEFQKRFAKQPIPYSPFIKEIIDFPKIKMMPKVSIIGMHYALGVMVGISDRGFDTKGDIALLTTATASLFSGWNMGNIPNYTAYGCGLATAYADKILHFITKS
ncbi:hypothetical protein J4405_02190 [Candidatus Woesearchaeota archaeon]|nr:hypothetical protein [Candidatus Woesearchaeota archaeon]